MLHRCQPAHVFPRQRDAGGCGREPDQERLFEGNPGGFTLCIPIKLDLGGKPIDCSTLPAQRRPVHKQLHKQRHTAGFCLSPSKHKVESVTFSSPHMRVLFGKERGHFKKEKVCPVLALGIPLSDREQFYSNCFV